MSIHHEVSIHCNLCGQWEYGNQNTTARRRKNGWQIWQDEMSGRWQHLCPACTSAGRTPESLDEGAA